jgi:predicted ArsR family transcriptional regulator
LTYRWEMSQAPPSDPSDLEDQISAIAALNEPVRRSLYRYAVAQAAAVGRDEAAQAFGISRELAAFHLDKLVEHGLLDVEYRRLSGRQGPGAGRPAKLYRRSGRQVAVAVPERRYDVAGRLLAQALEADGDPAEAVDRAAHRFGEELGAEARRHAGRRPSPERLLERACGALEAYGFEPIRSAGEVRLRNCPFDALAQAHTALVCGMNLSIMQGLLDGLRAQGLEAELAPEPGRCCVVLRRSGSGR